MKDLPEELQQRIAAYVDGELPPAEAARLEVYLANTDPALADSVVGMLADKVQVRALPKRHAPTDLSGRIMEQIERASLLREEDPAVRRRWWQSRAAVAAGLAVVLGGFTYFVASSISRPAADSRWTASETPVAGPLAKAVAEKQISPHDGGAASEGARDRMAAVETASGDVSHSSPQLAAVPAAPAPAKGAEPPSALFTETAPARAVTMAPAAAAAPAPAVAAAASRPETTLDQSTTLAAAVPNPAPNMGVGAMTGGGSAAGGGFGGGGPGGGGFGGGGGGVGGGRGGRGGAGGGGGGGGFGGGMGGAGGAAPGAAGRGGGGRGGGRAAATPAPAVVSGMQSIAPTTDNEVRTLASLTRDGSGPMVVTFLARDNADYSKLAASLAAYAGGNTVATNGNVIAGGPTTGGGGAQAAEGRLGAQQPMPQAAPSGTLSLSGGTLLDGYSNFNLNQGGVVVIDNLNGASQIAGGQAQRRSPSDTVEGTATSNRQLGSGPSTMPPANGVAGADLNAYGMQWQKLQQATAKGGPYRVTLRADQLEELSKTYRLAVVARGDTVVQFQTIGDKSPEAADATVRKDLLRRAGLASATVPATAVAEAAKAVGASSTVPAVVDCVITMEPMPATPATAAPPSNIPQ